MKFLTALVISAAVAMAAPSPNPNPDPWCWRIGQPCWKVKRTTELFADAVKSSGGLVARDEQKQVEDNGIPDDIAVNALESLHQLASLIAYSAHDPKIYLAELGIDESESKNEKRDVEVEDEDAPLEKRWCWMNRGKCWKAKRAAEAVLEATKETEEEEDNDASLEKRWCWRNRGDCWKAKRDLEMFNLAARGVLETLE